MTHCNHQKTERGFTLIELLVVIAIIGILASTVLASLSESRMRANDAKRLQDMGQIRAALELYYQDHRAYPGQTNDGVVVTGNFIGVGAPIDDALRPYLDPIPSDPRHDGVLYFYSYDPRHMTMPPGGDCSLSNYTSAVFGFNRAESIDPSTLQKDTCAGSNMNLNTAHYNMSLTPPAP